MTAPAPQPFAINGTLPGAGLTSIAASAGTGKTYAIAALATRFVVERDHDVADLLVLTFTRAAAGELRDRIRTRFREVADHLAQPAPPPTGDALLEYLASFDGARRATFARRATTAVERFDRATIGTIHSFCSAARSLLGSSAGINPDSSLSPSIETVVTATCTDVLATASLSASAVPLPDPAKVSTAVTKLLGDPNLRLWPSDNDSVDRACITMANQAATEVRQRLHDAGLMSFDTMVNELRDALTEGPHASERAHALADRFPLILLDEFQDTDASQWAIFSSMLSLPTPPTTVVVGDPKQAIYAFRGGDIHTYLAATESSGTTQLYLGTNHRCDPPMVEALNALFADRTFGDARIDYRPVGDAPTNGKRLELDGGRPLPSVDIRCVDPASDMFDGPSSSIKVDTVRAAVFADLATQVATLLQHGWLVDHDAGDSQPAPSRRLKPSDVAVLITAHNFGPAIQTALRDRGVDSVITRGQDVSSSEAAHQWRLLLAALSRPSDTRRARAAMLGWWWGLDESRLAAATDTEVANVQRQLAGWSAALRRQGVAAVVAGILDANGVTARLLSQPDGLRHLTDLTHIGELLDVAVDGRGCTPASLTSALANLRTAATMRDDDDDSNKQRTETDAPMVSIMTVHAAKGLEFPVVCCPTLWGEPRSNPIAIRQGERSYRVGGGSKEQDPWGYEAGLGEQLRLMYVALTRARHHTIMWWARNRRKDAPANLLLFGGPRPNSNGDPRGVATKDIAKLNKRFAATSAVTVSTFDQPADGTATEAATPVAAGDQDTSGGGPLGVARLDRPSSQGIRRWSFTTITADARPANHQRPPGGATPPGATGTSGGNPGEGAGDPNDDSLGDTGSSDEGDEQVVEHIVAPTADTTAIGQPLFDFAAAGANFGTLVHEVLERIDFAAPDDTLVGALQVEVERSGLATMTDPDRLVSALLAAITTPLGGPPDTGFGDLRLRDVTRGDRLDELRFELPLRDPRQGHPRPTVGVGDVAALVAEHLGTDDPMGAWARAFTPRADNLHIGGYLTGSIDLVLRHHRPDGTPQFSAVDYKTNRLETQPGDAALGAYDPRHLGVAMAGHDYPLQALLYAVALHRYLRWRVADYDPGVHLGPVGYLFLRGMVGPDSPRTPTGTSGVFVWQPPAALVDDLSDLLHDGVAS